MTIRLNIGDILSFWHDEIEKHCLLQVIARSEEGHVTGVILDGFFDAPPTMDALGPLQYLKQDHHNWKGEPMIHIIGPQAIPDDVNVIGNQPAILSRDSEHSNCPWPSGDSQIVLQYRWNALPAELTSAYKAAKLSDASLQANGREYRVNATRLNIDEGDSGFDFAELSKFPALTDLVFYTQTKQDPAPWLRKLPMVTNLEFDCPFGETIDISGTGVLELKVNVGGLKRLVLNTGLRDLILTGDLAGIDELEIIHPENGRWLQLHITGAGLSAMPDLELPNLTSLRVALPVVDFASLSAQYPRLQSLKIWGQPGTVTNLKSLADFPALETLWMFDLFGFEGSDFPPPDKLRQLENLWLSSVPKEAGSFAKKHFKNIRDLMVDKLRNDSWLALNVDNPFRSWDGRSGISKASSKKAFDAFKKLHAGIEQTTDKDKLTGLFGGYLDTFNGIYARQGGIDTMESEEIYTVYMRLAGTCGLDETMLSNMFEQNAAWL